MSTLILIRWSGLVSLLAGVLYALAALLRPVGEDLASVNNPNWGTAYLAYWVSAVLMQFGLVGLYARQAEKTGRLGLVSFVMAFIGTAFFGATVFSRLAVIPLIAAQTPAILDQAMRAGPVLGVLVIVLGFVLGYILFGVATMRAGVLPRWAGLLLIIGMSFFMVQAALQYDQMLVHVSETIGNVLFGLGLAWMGYALWSEKREPALTAKGAG